MNHNFWQYIFIDLLCFMVVILLFLYFGITNNTLDFYYFLFILFSYFRYKALQWKKYH